MSETEAAPRAHFFWYSLALVAGCWVVAVLLGVLAISSESAPACLVVCWTLTGPLTLLTKLDVDNQSLLWLFVAGAFLYWGIVTAVGGRQGWLEYRDWMGEPCDRLIGARRVSRDCVFSLVLLGAVAGYLGRPPLMGRRFAPTSAIIAHLIQIDGAKEQLALEKRLPEGHPVSEQELAAYLSQGEQSALRPALGERYEINPVGTYPRAVLDADVRVRRRGLDQGYTIPKGAVFELPSTLRSTNPPPATNQAR